MFFEIGQESHYSSQLETLWLHPCACAITKSSDHYLSFQQKNKYKANNNIS